MLREPVVLGAGVIRRDTALADGRDLFYYDDPDTTLGAERGIDQRALDPRPATATMRQDILTGDWISIAAARQNRAFLPPAELDPLDEFVRFAAANHQSGGTKAAFERDYWGQPGRFHGKGAAERKYAGMVTKMGLHFAVSGE